MVDLGLVGLGVCGDAVDARAGDAVFGELGAGGVQEAAAGGFGVAYGHAHTLSTKRIVDKSIEEL